MIRRCTVEGTASIGLIEDKTTVFVVGAIVGRSL